MRLRRALPVLIAVLSLTGCASSQVDLVPAPAGDSPVKVSGTGVATLQVQVQNQGIVASESSPVTVKFFLRNVVLTSAIQDGGPLQAGESSEVLEFEIPEDCVEGGCGFQVYVDPHKDLEGENRSNNLARGHCEGTVVSTPDPSPETRQPQVQ
jgi:hypothetical protein